ncbi:hypothetical protein D3227_10670 [Mesorhizobium waimense]|uniref:Uncharacterized protein n=1 Tax=Mesorhizobium waimense TaxID=1300307 RepID=A0A3A5KXS2_9HYPH|nr:hypothetical protein [Mesorhizobium waimense]RJT40416.1 hypothetical protein D3227_10670 [Mesorhizobium waimense]
MATPVLVEVAEFGVKIRTNALLRNKTIALGIHLDATTSGRPTPLPVTSMPASSWLTASTALTDLDQRWLQADWERADKCLEALTQ